MINLLRSNMMRLRKFRAFKIEIICVFIMGIVTVFLEKMNEDSFTHPYGESYFQTIYMLMLIVSTIVGGYISKDYVDNTIRNKISIGHKRLDIFIANHITTFYIYFLTVVTWTISYLFFGSFILNTDKIDKEALGVGIIVMLFAVISFSGISVFFCMTVKNSFGGALTGAFFYVTMFVQIFEDIFDSKIFDFFIDFFPNLQMAYLSPFECDEKPLLHIIYSLIIFVVSFAGGYRIFRKTDLN